MTGARLDGVSNPQSEITEMKALVIFFVAALFPAVVLAADTFDSPLQQVPEGIGVAGAPDVSDLTDVPQDTPIIARHACNVCPPSVPPTGVPEPATVLLTLAALPLIRRVAR